MYSTASLCMWMFSSHAVSHCCRHRSWGVTVDQGGPHRSQGPGAFCLPFTGQAKCLREGCGLKSYSNGPVLATDFRTARILYWKWHQLECLGYSFHYQSLDFHICKAMTSACTVKTPCSHCPLLRLSDCSCPAWYSLLYHYSSMILMQYRCLKHIPFKGLYCSCNSCSAFCSVPVAQQPCHSWDWRGSARDRRGDYLLCPHHLPRTLGFQEPAGVWLRDPSSLVSFNSPLKAESPRRQKYFSLYLFWLCCHDSIFIFPWCKQKAPYMQLV